ncbi:hypothetical protein, partial [Arthrobacter sp. H41]|uniref:hypothetical protein n=1 Tax=Arthrobacter sp. H41 TaxID=1312978 RepID=UPI00067651DB
GGFASLRDRVEAVGESLALLAGAQESLEAAERTGVRLGRVHRTLANVLEASIFSGRDEARAALLPLLTVEAHGKAMRAYDDAGHRLSIEWEDAAVGSAVADEEAGLSALTQEEMDAAITGHEQLVEQAGAAAVTARLLDQSVLQVRTYRTLLHRQEEVTVPLRDELRLTSSVAESALGGGENAYKMSLSTDGRRDHGTRATRRTGRGCCRHCPAARSVSAAGSDVPHAPAPPGRGDGAVAR